MTLVDRAPRCCLPRRRDRRGAAVPAAPQQRDVPPQRGGPGVDRRRTAARVTHLASGKQISSDTLLYATGRQGATESLALENAGLEADKRGRIAVDDEYRTAVPHIFAVGDVAGAPGWPPRRWSRAASPRCTPSASPVSTMPELIPTGVYAIPEIAWSAAPRRS